MNESSSAEVPPACTFRLALLAANPHRGLAAASIAKAHGCHVTSTSRSAKSKDLVLSTGADAFRIDDGALSANLPAGEKYHKILELVGTTTLHDSLACCTSHGFNGGRGVVCMTGMAGNSWTLKEFSPMDEIPDGCALVKYDGGKTELGATPYPELVGRIERGEMKVVVGKTMSLEDVVEAHRIMEAGKAGGKIVLLPQHKG